MQPSTAYLAAKLTMLIVTHQTIASKRQHYLGYLVIQRKATVNQGI